MTPAPNIVDSSPAGPSRAVAALTIQLTALGLVLSGLWSLWKMVAALGHSAFLVNSGVLNLVLAWGLLRHRPWARSLTLLACWLTFVGLPLMAALAFSGTAPVRYELPAPLAELAGPPAIGLVSASLFLLALWVYAMFTSNPGRAWFALPPRAAASGRRRAISLFVAAAVASLAAVWLALQPALHLELVAARGGTLTDLAVDGQRGYVLVGGRLGVLDLTDPDQPRLVGQASDAFGRQMGDLERLALAAVGDQALVTSWDDQALMVVDATDPTRPQVEGTTALPLLPRAISVAGDAIYVLGEADTAATDSLLVALDQDSAPWASPAIVAQWQIPGSPRDLAAGPGLALALTGWRCDPCEDPAQASALLSVMDTSSLDTGEPVGSIAVPASSTALALWGERGYVLTGDGQLLTIDLLRRDRPEVTNTLAVREPGPPSWHCPLALVASSDRLFVSDYCGKRLIVVDPSAPDQPRVSGGTEGVTATQLAAGADRLFAIDRLSGDTWKSVGMAVIGISKPDRPRPSGGWDSFTAYRVVPIAARAYVVQERGRLRLLDVTDPEQPVDLGVIGPPDVADAAAADGRLFVVTGDGRFGHMEPAGTLVGALALPPPPDADDRWRIHAIADGLAYLATYQGSELHMVDVSSPDQPVLRGSAMPGGRVSSVAAGSQHAYVAIEPLDGARSYSSDDGASVVQLVVLDVSDPAAPRTVDAIRSWEPLMGPSALLVDGRRLYFGDSDAGLCRYSLLNPAHPSRERAWSDQSAWSLARSEAGLLAGSNSLRLYYTGPLRSGTLADDLDSFLGASIAAASGFTYVADAYRGLAVVAVRAGPASGEAP